MMKKQLWFTGVCLLIFISVQQSYAGIVVIERFKSETIQYKATGVGFFPNNDQMSPAQKKEIARRVAEIDAYRNLMEKINEIHIDSNTTIKNFLTEKDEVNASLSGYIKGAKLMNVREEDGGLVKVDAVIDLGKDFYDIFEPHIK